MDDPAEGTFPPAQVVEQPADASGEIVKQADYPDLRVGDCVRDMDSEENLDLEVVFC